ncbi:MAG TPA: hypothetical protein VHY91_27285 [Pirellulales bacterium]|nr:hypothetical protein [Pirellulales bacterium]
MSTIASCPRCAQQVIIPSGAAATDTVRCPLCTAEYQLAEAMAKAPPTLVVVSSLAEVAPEPAPENQAELHQFPAAESPYDFTDVGSGSSELPVGEVHAASPEEHSLPLDLHEAPLMAEVHGQDLSNPPADIFPPAEADTLELPSHELAGEAPAHAEETSFADSLFGDAHEAHPHPVAETAESDFLTTFDHPEPAAGAAAEEHLPTDEPHTLDLEASEPDWLTAESESSQPTEIESSGINLGGHVPHPLGETVTKTGGEELSFDSEEGESLDLDAGERGFDTVNLDSGFEETRAIPEGVEGYSLDSGPAEEEEAHDEALVEMTDGPARPARRKPSFIFGLVMYVLGLFVILPGVYLALMWGASMDPLKLAPMMPGIIVPAALNVRNQMARGIPANQLTPPPGMADNQPAGAPADQNGAPSEGVTPGAPGEVPGEDAPTARSSKPAAADANGPGDADMPEPEPADAAPDTGADAEEPDGADAAAMAADKAGHDPDAGPGDADMPDTDVADSDSAPADADEPADDMPADKPAARKGAADADAADADEPADDMPADEMPADRKGAAEADTADADADTDADAEAADSDAMPAKKRPALAAEADDAEPEETATDDKGDEMPADRDATAEDMPEEDKDAAADKADAELDDDAPKKPAKVTDDSPVGAALDEAMTDEDSAEPVGPRDSVEYTPADVNKALTEVASASRALDLAAEEAAGKAGDTATKAELKKTKGQFYRKLYQLAEVATFTPSMAASPEAEQGSQQDLVDHTLVDSAASPGKFDEVGRAAAKWLAAIKGKEHQGIVLSGTLKSTAQRGKVFESQVLLTDGQQVVTVLSPAAPSVEPASPVLVWGSVEVDPAEKIAGYEGDAKTAVWTTAVEAAPPAAAAKPADAGASAADAKPGTALAK